ncbi:hypothetical protein [Actinomadura opuntiae]|nr:hypothetical protein [Actinomadura sp. OS1-43]MDL4813597.1 hypothetical protein [Actinomadura sp. OS1-43]
MRTNDHARNPKQDPKKGKNKQPDFRSAAIANNRRNARRLPTRQFNRGR